MKKQSTVYSLFLALILCFAAFQVNALDYPHFGVNSIGCDSCHFIYGTEPSLLPEWTSHTPEDIDDTQYNTLCWSCHNDIEAPYVRTHSSLQIDDSYGNWTVQCIVCHNPHYQKQTEHGSESYLYSSTSSSVTANSLTKESAGWTDDEYENMVVIPNVSENKYVYKITGNTSDTLTIEGPIEKALTGDTFAILYGQLVYDTVVLDKIINPDPARSGNREVKFFRKTGDNSFADGDSTYDGICEVCHQRTKYHKNDGSGSSHNAGNNCTQCHGHLYGFAHGGGASGTGCDECHGHDPGYDGKTGGAGTYQTHSTHTENDDEHELKGPNVDCDTCHNTSSFPNFADGVSYADYKSGAAMTTVCNTCHSPGGTYNGVNSVSGSIGAKDNWSTGVYNSDSSLKVGKEKWCAGCHDESPSQIQGVDAPNIIGDEDAAYNYGKGWGFYKTGHGLPTSETFPASGGVTDGAGKKCSDCHDQSAVHIDGNQRTFEHASGDGSALYQSGYRLKDVDGNVPMDMPPVNGNSYRLCFSCHTNTDAWTTTDRHGTNFYNEGNSTNDHYKHMSFVNATADCDWDGGWEDGNASCIYCHNVHGSTNPSMVRDGSLNGKSGMVTRYGNSCDNSDWANSDITLAESTILATQKSSIQGPYCATTCHGTGTGFVTITRTPSSIPDRVPELNWVGGPAYESDGVNPDAAPSGTEFTFKVRYSDINKEGPPTTIQLWIDRDNNGSYVDNADPDLDEKIDMVSAFAEPDGCSSYFTGVDYVAYVSLEKSLLISGNTITYKFYAYYGLDTATGPPTYESTLILLNDAPELEWTGDSNYESDGVNPDYGDTCPASGSSNIQLWIDPENDGYETDDKYNLTEVSSGDTDCTTSGGGKLYYSNQNLSTSGTYNYRFYANDGTDDATGTPADTGGSVTVVASTNNPPLLTWETGTCRPEGALPPRSALSSTIDFMVRYYDEDNQCPTSGSSDIQVWVDLNGINGYEAGEKFNLTEVDTDSDCTTPGGGKLYKLDDLTPTTVADDITYEFHATDGTDEALGDPRTVGGTVDVVDADQVVRQDGTEDWTTIQAAINAGGTNYQTILVYDGTYNETVTMNLNGARKILSACGAVDTIISNTNDPVVLLHKTYGTEFDGFTVTGSSGNGIRVTGTHFDASSYY
jgi:hypothetical protein